MTSSDPLMRRNNVAGYCPACGRASLHVATTGHVRCWHPECPRPDAVVDLLNEQEIHHLVDFRDTTFNVKHPLIERVGNDLFDCTLHAYIGALPSMPVPAPGIYRAVPDGDEYTWEPVR